MLFQVEAVLLFARSNKPRLKRSHILDVRKYNLFISWFSSIIIYKKKKLHQIYVYITLIIHKMMHWLCWKNRVFLHDIVVHKS